MKTIKYIIALFILSFNGAYSQTLNWKSFTGEDNKKQFVSVALGANYGMDFQAGYGHSFHVKWFPVVATVDYSFPSGNKIFDDFKTRIGGQIRWVEYHNVHFSTKITGVMRRTGNDYVRMINFGSDMSAIAGYYKPKWFAALECGFDKAIVTNFRHTQAYRDQYPLVSDGWYEPATGGNFYYGIQAGITFNKMDFAITAGKVITQDFETTPLVPFYGQAGINFKF